MEPANPYSPPQASLADAHQDTVLAATRGQRLIAVLLDAVINLAFALPLMFVSGIFEYSKRGQQPPLLLMLGMVAVSFIPFILIHGYFLKRNGQTLGKKIVGIKITDLNNEVPRLSKILLLRYLPISLVTLIPSVGNILVCIDSLFIFRSDRRCIHDLIAGTKVVQAKKRA